MLARKDYVEKSGIPLPSFPFRAICPVVLQCLMECEINYLIDTNWKMGLAHPVTHKNMLCQCEVALNGTEGHGLVGMVVMGWSWD